MLLPHVPPPPAQPPPPLERVAASFPEHERYPFRLAGKIASNQHPLALSQRWWLRGLERQVARQTRDRRDAFNCWAVTIYEEHTRPEFVTIWALRYLPNVVCMRAVGLEPWPMYGVALFRSGKWRAERLD